MDFPKVFSRITDGRSPRYQLYQPGFNNSNGCWLRGSWLSFTKAEWENKRKNHEKMYAKVKEESKKQSHHSKGVPLKKMTPAQRQAYEYFSGEAHLDCLVEDRYQPIGVKLAGNHINKSSLAWMKKEGYKVIRLTKAYKRIEDQTKGMVIPPELVIDNKKPIDTVRMTIDQNKSRQREMDRYLTAQAKPETEDFYSQMAFHGLTELEESIIRAEWERKYHKKDKYDDMEEDIATYVEQRAELKKKFPKKFDEFMAKSRESHNECARTNLINSKRHLFCWVLPVFNDDGTHEPWKEEDTPDPTYDPWAPSK